MNSALVSLFWKECREHSWKVVALAVVVVGLHVWALDATEPGPDHYAIPMLATIWFVLPLGAAFLGMGAAAGERSQGTAAWLRALPIDPRRVAVTKLAVGMASLLLTQAVAVALTTGLIFLANQQGWCEFDRAIKPLAVPSLFEPTGAPTVEMLVLRPTLFSLFVSGSVFLWVAALGVNRESEVRAAAIGLVVIVALWTAFFSAFFWNDRNATNREIIESVLAYVSAALPAGMGVAMSQRYSTSLTLLIPFLLVHAALVAWYVGRFGQIVVSRADASAQPARRVAGEWLAPPRLTPATALVWKQFRQALPVLLAGVVGATGITITLLLTYTWDSLAAGADQDVTAAGAFTMAIGAIVMAAFLTLGCCAGLVGGVGLMGDLEPRLATFWRSRPINPNAWFWIAVGVGFALLVVAFGVPVLVGEQLATRLSSEELNPVTPAIGILLSFAAGVFCAALVRRPVYASLMGIGVAMGVIALGSYERMPWAPDAIGPALVVGCALLLAAAWYAIRRDWAVLR